MYYVYIIRNEKGELYTGYTSDLRRRLQSHNEGKTKSTREHQWEVIYYEAYKAEQDARNRELALKKSGAARKWLRDRLSHSLTLNR